MVPGGGQEIQDRLGFTLVINGVGEDGIEAAEGVQGGGGQRADLVPVADRRPGCLATRAIATGAALVARGRCRGG
jgi:hypothetical protein